MRDNYRNIPGRSWQKYHQSDPIYTKNYPDYRNEESRRDGYRRNEYRKEETLKDGFIKDELRKDEFRNEAIRNEEPMKDGYPKESYPKERYKVEEYRKNDYNQDYGYPFSLFTIPPSYDQNYNKKQSICPSPCMNYQRINIFLYRNSI